MPHTGPGKYVNDEIERYGSDVLHSELMQQAFRQKHHLRSTVGEHTLRVARTSIKIGRTLQKLHVRVDIPAVVIGSLCHDLGIVGRDEKYSSDKECYKKHSADSVTIARDLLDDLPEKCILKASHASGFNLIVDDKTRLDPTEISNLLDQILHIHLS